MILQLDGSGDMQRAVPMSAAQFGNDFILTTLLQHVLYVLADGLLEILLCLLELHLLAFDAWGLYLDRFSVRGLSPGIAVVLGIAVVSIAVLGATVGWSVEHLAVKFALLLSYRYSFDGYGRELVCGTFRFTCSLSLSFALAAIATALVGGLKGLFVARAAPVVAASKSVAIYGTLHIAYAQFSHRRMATLPHLYRL